MTWRDALLARPSLSIVLIALGLRLSTTLLILIIHRVFPSFDASATRLSTPLNPDYQGFVRWDTVYFLEIANNGYTQEQRLAFFPGLPGLLRVGGELVRWASRGDGITLEAMVFAGMISTTLATTLAAPLLYQLTFKLSSSRQHSLVTTILFLLGPARAVLHAVPYTEPFSALFTFAGMLSFSHHADFVSSLCFAFATLFRAQGAVLGLGFFGWRYILERPFRANRLSLKVLLRGVVVTMVLSLISASPFFAFQAYAYREYCSDPTSLRPWCTSTFGFSYEWIQSHYWDVGPFRYWTLQQLPNFFLATPLLFLSFSASYTYYSSQPSLVLSKTFPFIFSSPKPSSSVPNRSRRPVLSLELLPFIHLHTATTLLLLISSHVQIILRLCIVNPVVWWYASDLVLSNQTQGDEDGDWRKRKRWGERWVKYCIVWGTLSVVCWALFLPPA
ncbi:hypothetical protein JCM16303_000518 [Sporobolomyces ruberrimus]